MPGYEFNSPEVLLDMLEKLFKGRTFPMSAEVIRSVVESPEDESGIADVLCDEELDDELGALKDVKALVYLLFNKIGNFTSATEIGYDLLFQVWCSKKDHWHDMYEALTKKGKDLFNPESLGKVEKEKAKENQLNEIKAFQKEVDECRDKKIVHWMRVVSNDKCLLFLTTVMSVTNTAPPLLSSKDRMLSAFEKDEELKHIITTECNMKEIHRYLEEATVYVYRSEAGCVGFIFLHHAFSKSLSSLPPWRDRNFSDAQFQDQGRAGIAFDWNQAVGFTFDRVEGHEDKMISPNTLIGSLLVAFVLRMYIIHRMHHGDYRIATLFAKDLATIGEDKYKPLQKMMLKQKWINSWARERKDNTLTYAQRGSQATQIMNKLSGPRSAEGFENRMRDACNMVLKSACGHDRLGPYGGSNEFESVLATLQPKFLKGKGEIFKDLNTLCYEERDRRINAKKQMDAEKERAQNDRMRDEEGKSEFEDGVEADPGLLDELGVL